MENHLRNHLSKHFSVSSEKNATLPISPFPGIVHCTFQTFFQLWRKVSLGSLQVWLLRKEIVQYHLLCNVNYGFKKFNLQLSSANNENHLGWLVWKSKLIDPATLEPFTEHENRQDNIMLSRVNQTVLQIIQWQVLENVGIIFYMVKTSRVMKSQKILFLK